MNYSLPTSLEVNGTEYAIQSDFRAVLDILTALSQSDMTGQEKTLACLGVFYPDLDEMPVSDYQEALQACFRFIDKAPESKKQKKEPQIMSWEQDFDMIIAPVNRIAGCEIRSLPYLHWWTFLSYYQEIGDCLFAQVVHIRDKKARGKTLDKQEREFYRNNREIIDLKTTYTESEKDVLAAWGIKK